MKNSGLQGLAEDSAVKKISNGKLLVSNVDIFTPLHDDPVIMGKITACNATNDVFAMNVTDLVLYLSFLGVPHDQPDEITEGLLKGQREFLSQFDADINGGHTIVNPWPLMGGIVTGIIDEKDLISKQINPKSKGGDIIITKPLGIQAAMASYRILKDEPELLEDYDPKQLISSIDMAVKAMTTSNYYVAKTIKQNDLSSAIPSMTDITGFGLKGHASEMIMDTKFDIQIDTIPVIRGTNELSDLFGYGLSEGCAAETAGPMLLCVDTEKMDTEEIQRLFLNNGIKSWKIGSFREGFGKFSIKDDVQVMEILDY